MSYTFQDVDSREARILSEGHGERRARQGDHKAPETVLRRNGKGLSAFRNLLNKVQTPRMAPSGRHSPASVCLCQPPGPAERPLSQIQSSAHSSLHPSFSGSSAPVPVGLGYPGTAASLTSPFHHHRPPTTVGPTEDRDEPSRPQPPSTQHTAWTPLTQQPLNEYL